MLLTDGDFLDERIGVLDAAPPGFEVVYKGGGDENVRNDRTDAPNDGDLLELVELERERHARDGNARSNRTHCCGCQP